MTIDKFILIGDTHFGIKNFNEAFFKNQLKLFNEQIFPYMKDNNIEYIIQTGDLFDNRVTIDINFLDTFMKNFVNILEEKNIKLVTILGNHDVYFKNRVDVNLSKYISKMTNSIITIQQQETINFNDKNILLVPWLTESDKIIYDKQDIIIGHFEIKNFQLTKGNIDTKSVLDEDYFNKLKVSKIYSGHYHINQQNGKIHYVGTPYELNWGDFQNKCGFYVIEKDNETFINNTVTRSHVKITWDERLDYATLTNSEGSHKVAFDNLINNIKENYILKITNLYSPNNSFEDFLFKLKEKGIKYTFYNEQELNTIINPDNIEITESKVKNTDSFVIDYIKDNHPELKDLIVEILDSIKDSDE